MENKNWFFDLIDNHNHALLTEIESNVYLFSKNSHKKTINSGEEYLTDLTFEYSDHYQNDAELFDYSTLGSNKSERIEIKRLHEKILKDVPKEAACVLDVGCGGGWVSKALIKKGYNVISSDISTINPIKAVKGTFSSQHFGLIADAYELPFRDNSIDCIIASEIMEHVASPQLFIEYLMSKLTPHGRLIITTPYNEKITYHLCVHCNKLTPTDAHLHSFNEKNIRNIINSDYSWKYRKFTNKILILTRIHLLLNFLPFYLWNIVDISANKIISKELRFMLILSKKAN